MDEPEASLVLESSDAGFERPSPRVRIVWLVSRTVFWVFVIAGVAIVDAVGDTNLAWALSPSLLWLLPPLHIGLTWFRYKGWGYRVREHDLLVRRGVLIRSYSAIPLARIQQVDTSTGPVERRLGLTSLVVRTAGARTARTRIPGLPSARAAQLRDELSREGHERAE